MKKAAFPHAVGVVVACASAGVWAAPIPAKLSPAARGILKKLPDETLSVELVLGLAAVASDSFRSVTASAPLIEATRLQGQIPFETQLKAASIFQWDRLESTSPVSYESLDVWTNQIEASRYFGSGTALGGKLGIGKSNATFAPASGFPAVSSYETKFELTVAQNLWRDAFGSASRAAATSAERGAEATELQLRESVEEWSLGLLRQYYLAWQLQERVESTEGSARRQRRLLDASRAKARRGTAEAQDLLRVESSFLGSETQQLQAETQLREAWTNLVYALKLPEAFLDLDPRHIPLRLDDPIAEATGLCREGAEKFRSENVALRRAEVAAEAARLKEDSVRGQAKPNLQLIAGLAANGQDPSFGATPGETFSFVNPSYQLGLQFSMPLGFRAEEAQYRVALADKLRTEALASQASGQFAADWRNACRDLARLEEGRRQAREISEKQIRREGIEERLFGIGSTNTLNVIQAGEDANFARLGLAQAEVEARLAAWRIRRLTGRVVPWLKDLEARSNDLRSRL